MGEELIERFNWIGEEPTLTSTLTDVMSEVDKWFLEAQRTYANSGNVIVTTPFTSGDNTWTGHINMPAMPEGYGKPVLNKDDNSYYWYKSNYATWQADPCANSWFEPSTSDKMLELFKSIKV